MSSSHLQATEKWSRKFYRFGMPIDLVFHSAHGIPTLKAKTVGHYAAFAACVPVSGLFPSEMAIQHLFIMLGSMGWHFKPLVPTCEPIDECQQHDES